MPGNEVYLSFEPKAMHFFNPENELNLLAKEGAVNSKGPIILPGEAKEEKLVEEMDCFIDEFKALRNAIKNEDEELIKEKMILSTRRRSYFNKK